MSALTFALCAVLAGAPLEDARRHYQRLEYDQALALLEAARRDAGTDSTKLAQVWLLEAFVQLALGRQSEGSSAMRRALSLNPALELPLDASPKLRSSFDEAKKQLAERRARRAAVAVRAVEAAAPPVAQRGFDVSARVEKGFDGLEVRLVVRDAKAGAEATLPMTALGSGRYAGRVPAELASPSASLTLTVEVLDDGVAITAAEPLTVKLPRHRAAIEVSSPHDGAEVLVDGAAAGTIPLSAALPVEPGTRRLLLHLSDGEVAQDVDVAPGQIAAVTLKVAGASKRVRAGVGLLVASGIVLVASVVFAALAVSAARQLEGAVRREPGSGLPLSDFSQVMGLERVGTAFQVTAIVAAVAGVLGIGTGSVLWFGAAR